MHATGMELVYKRPHHKMICSCAFVKRQHKLFPYSLRHYLASSEERQVLCVCMCD